MGEEIEELRTELDYEKEEKDQLRLKLEQSTGEDTSEENAAMNEEQLKKENERLKSALRQISGQMEMEKATRGQELVEVKDELKRIQGFKNLLAEKENDVNLLLEELEEKEKQLSEKEIEIKGLHENIDANRDLELMVEELTNNILEKQEEVEELKSEITALKEELEVEEEAINEAEKLAQILQKQVEEKEYEINRGEQDRKKLQGRVKELEELSARFREKVVDLSTEREQLHQKLADSSEGELKLKLHQVMDKQSQMFHLLREASRKEVAYRYSQIIENQTRNKNEWMISLLPQKLLNYSKIESFHKVQLVETLKGKTYLLLHELQNSCFLNMSRGEREVAMIEGTDPHLFFRWSCDLYYNSATLLDVLLKIGFVMSGLDTQRYEEINEVEWGNLRAAEAFLDNFIKLAKEESLTPSISLSPYTSTVGAIQDFYLTKFAEFSNEAGNAPKLSSRHGLVLIKLGVLGLVRTSTYLREISHYKERAVTLLKLIGEVIFKIDLIPASNTGSPYILIEHELGKKLETKFEFAQILWRESSNDDDSDGAASYDWGAWLEAIERDIWSLSKSPEFKKIAEDSQNDPCTQFLRTSLAAGPWTQIAARVREELEKAASKNERIKELTDKISQIRLAWRKCQQELKDTLILKIQLQRKAAELNQRAMRIPALQDENARLNENLTQYQNSLVECRNAIEQLTVENKELANAQPVVMPTQVVRAQNRRLETMAQPVGEARGFDFIPRTVIGDRGIIKEYKELVKGMIMQNSNAQYDLSLALLRRINHNSHSSFNRFMSSKRPQNAQRKSELKTRMERLEKAINKVKETQGTVRILRISENPYDPIRAYRTQHQEQLTELYKAKEEIKEFSSRVHQYDPRLLEILTQEVLVNEQQLIQYQKGSE